MIVVEETKEPPMLLESLVIATLCVPGKPEPFQVTHVFRRAPGVHPREYYDPHAYPPLHSHHQVELAKKFGARTRTIRLRLQDDPQVTIYDKFYHAACTAVG